jgi:hypothetical protein
VISSTLRKACAESTLLDLLSPAERAFYSALPSLIPVWRGCEGGRERGISWTTDRSVAEQFAWGKRCKNSQPTLVRAEIPKQHIFAVFVDRQESELAIDYRRLRRLLKTPPSSMPWWQAAGEQQLGFTAKLASRGNDDNA